MPPSKSHSKAKSRSLPEAASAATPILVSTPGPTEPFVFLHVGDTHLTDPRPPTPATCDEILAQIAGIHHHGGFDFVYLPGDLAENGCAAEYEILAKALAHHPKLPVRLIPGDHDRQPAGWTTFRRSTPR